MPAGPPTSVASRTWRSIVEFVRGGDALPPPGKGAWRLFASTFFFFSTIGYISALSATKRMPDTLGVLLGGVTAGLIAVGYAYAIAYRKWWLLIVPIAFHYDLATRLVFEPVYRAGFVHNVDVLSEEGATARKLAVTATIIGLALGQFFMIRFIATIVRRGASDRAELAIAQRMHASIVPAVKLEAHGFVIEGLSDTSQRMGGDLCDAVRVGEDAYAVVADVSGHGVGAGLIMTMVKGCVRTRLVQGGELPAILADINRVLCDQLSEGVFVTMAMARMRGNGVIEVALAGHPPALVVGGADATRIENGSLPLGLKADETFVASTTTLAAGQTLVLYTDGLFERKDERDLLSDKDLGIEGFAQLLTQAHSQGTRDASGLMQVLRGPQPPADDQTLLVVRS